MMGMSKTILIAGKDLPDGAEFVEGAEVKMRKIAVTAAKGAKPAATANITAQTIGASAFYNCTGLTSLTLSERVKTLEGFAFAYTGMSTVTIPASLTSYGIGAFAYCSNLTKFNVASGSTYFATDSNTPNCLYNYSKTILHQMGAGTNPIPGALSVYMPNTLTTISTYAMAGTRLYTVDVPYGVKSIYPYAFSGMPNVQTFLRVRLCLMPPAKSFPPALGALFSAILCDLLHKLNLKRKIYRIAGTESGFSTGLDLSLGCQRRIRSHGTCRGSLE